MSKGLEDIEKFVEKGARIREKIVSSVESEIVSIESSIDASVDQIPPVYLFRVPFEEDIDGLSRLKSGEKMFLLALILEDSESLDYMIGREGLGEELVDYNPDMARVLKQVLIGRAGSMTGSGGLLQGEAGYIRRVPCLVFKKVPARFLDFGVDLGIYENVVNELATDDYRDFEITLMHEMSHAYMAEATGYDNEKAPELRAIDEAAAWAVENLFHSSEPDYKRYEREKSVPRDVFEPALKHLLGFSQLFESRENAISGIRRLSVKTIEESVSKRMSPVKVLENEISSRG